MTLADLTSFLGWCTVISFAFLLLATVALTAFRGAVMGIHGRFLGMTPAELMPMYVTYLAQFKILVIVFNLVPWIALQVM